MPPGIGYGITQQPMMRGPDPWHQAPVMPRGPFDPNWQWDKPFGDVPIRGPNGPIAPGQPGHPSGRLIRPSVPAAPQAPGVPGAVPPGTAPPPGGGVPAPGGTGGTGTTPAPGGVGTVQTSITPQGIYTPDQTQAAVNLARAREGVAGNMQYLLKNLGGRGFASSSPAARMGVLPQVAQSRLNAGAAGAVLPFADALANAQHLLAGQTAREGEGLGLAGALARASDAQTGYGTSQNMAILNLLGQLLGGAA